MLVIFDLGLGQSGALDDRPHHRLGALIEQPAHREFQQLAGDDGLGVIAHREIRIAPVALDAQPLELGALHVDPPLRELAAFAAELDDIDLVLVLALGAVLFLDLPLDRQAVAVPAGHVVRVLAHHAL